MSIICPECNSLKCKCNELGIIDKLFHKKSPVVNKSKFIWDKSIDIRDNDKVKQLQRTPDVDKELNTSGHCCMQDKTSSDTNCTHYQHDRKSLTSDDNLLINSSVVSECQIIPEANCLYDNKLCFNLVCTMVIITCLHYVFNYKQEAHDQNDKTNVNTYGFSKCKGIKISCHNINRLECKFDEIKYNLMFSENQPDIVGFCETFLNQNTNDHELHVPGYECVRKDREKCEGGGWAIYFSNKITFVRKQNFEISALETVWFEVQPIQRKSFLLCFVYRPPSSLISWIDDFETELQQAMSWNSDIILMGDFNMNYLPPIKPCQKWLNILEAYHLHQQVTEATRVTKDSKTLIDHIYVTHKDMVQKINVPKYAISDHYPICLVRCGKVDNKKNTHTTISYRNFSNFNEENFLLDLKNATFHQVEYESDPNVCIQIWYDIFNSVLNKHAPIISKRVKKDRQPEWYNNEIMYARKMRDKYHALGMWGEYRFWRNKTKVIIDESKKKYYGDMVKDTKDSKTLWKCIHSLNPSSKVKPYELITDGKNKIHDPREMANIFNNFFTSCVDNLRKNSSNTTNANLSELGNFVKQKLSKVKHDQFTIPPVRVNEVFDNLVKLNGRKSAGSDNIGPKILQLSATHVATSLTYIFNRIIDTGVYPLLLKNAKVSPVYKSGDKFLATNYRPISVLPTLSKLIEKHVAKHMYSYLSKFQLLHNAQSGFRPNHSCQTALINIIDKWLQDMNDGNLNLAVLLDFKKAFDVVDHNILCQKLGVYGFSELSVNFFKSYLMDRTQQVHIGNVFSEQQPVKFGVPQGSILGPLLFVLYINDFPLYLKNCETDLYADDTTVHVSGRDLNNLQTKVQSDLEEVERWCNDNYMFINTNKTKCMVIGTKQKILSHDNELNLRIGSDVLQNSVCEKLLGVKIDQSLSWKYQIDHICSIMSSRIYLLSKIKKYLDIVCRKLFYNGYILPIIDYCCIVWSGCSSESLARILKLQKRAARLILDADPLSPSEPLFKQLGWMTVDQRIKYHKCLLTYKCVKTDEAPTYLSEKFKFISDSNPYLLRNTAKGNLVTPKPNKELYKKSFVYSGSVLWNDLPSSVRCVNNTNTFKKRMKDLILS